MQLSIGDYEVGKPEGSIEPAGVRHDPGVRAFEPFGLQPPVDERAFFDDAVGGFAHECEMEGRIFSDARSQGFGARGELVTGELARARRRAAHRARQAASVAQELLVFGRGELDRREAGFVENAPEAIGWIRERTLHGGRTEAWVEAAKYDVKTRYQKIRKDRRTCGSLGH